MDLSEVLIVENDVDFAALLTRECNRQNVRHVVVSCAEEAVAYVNKKEPSVVVLDLKLPWRTGAAETETKDNGRKVFEAISTVRPFVPIIVASAYDYTELAVAMAKKAGADYFQKTDGNAVRGIVSRIRHLQAGKVLTMRQTLWKFAKMMEDDSLLEHDFQSFFESNWWMFGYVEYVGARRQERPDKNTRTDFLLERFDGFFDIWEIKLPKAPLFRTVRKGVFALSSECAAAVGQVFEYIDIYDSDIDRNRSRYGDNIYLPRGIVVIGRDNPEYRNRLRIENENSKRIHILTYDDLLIRSKRVVEFVKRVD